MRGRELKSDSRRDRRIERKFALMRGRELKSFVAGFRHAVDGVRPHARAGVEIRIVANGSKVLLVRPHARAGVEMRVERPRSVLVKFALMRGRELK